MGSPRTAYWTIRYHLLTTVFRHNATSAKRVPIYIFSGTQRKILFRKRTVMKLSVQFFYSLNITCYAHPQTLSPELIFPIYFKRVVCKSWMSMSDSKCCLDNAQMVSARERNISGILHTVRYRTEILSHVLWKFSSSSLLYKELSAIMKTYQKSRVPVCIH